MSKLTGEKWTYERMHCEVLRDKRFSVCENVESDEIGRLISQAPDMVEFIIRWRNSTRNGGTFDFDRFTSEANILIAKAVDE